jgi:hypothetical protein
MCLLLRAEARCFFEGKLVGRQQKQKQQKKEKQRERQKQEKERNRDRRGTKDAPDREGVPNGARAVQRKGDFGCGGSYGPFS